MRPHPFPIGGAPTTLHTTISLGLVLVTTVLGCGDGTRSTGPRSETGGLGPGADGPTSALSEVDSEVGGTVPAPAAGVGTGAATAGATVAGGSVSGGELSSDGATSDGSGGQSGGSSGLPPAGTEETGSRPASSSAGGGGGSPSGATGGSDGETIDVEPASSGSGGDVGGPGTEGGAPWGSGASGGVGPRSGGAGAGDGGTDQSGAESVSGGTGGHEVAGAGTGADGASGSNTGGTSTTCPATYSNPVIWEDLPDLEVIRVGDTYYYTASTFHYSPGAPVLRSYDLVNWEYVGHSVPVLDFHPSYDLEGSRSYVNGIWASSLRYRESDETFYWIGCMHNVGGGHVFTAPSAEGPWTEHPSEQCYYDVGLLIDDDDTLYVAYGNSTISVAELTTDGFGEVRSQQVFTSPSDIGPLEGSRFYRIDGNYYIFVTQYANGEYVLRSTSGPFGPYTLRPFAVGLPFAGQGAGASPHQGGIVETQNGDWYYMGFNDAYPAGRIPVLAPLTWDDGWPSLTLVAGAWGASYSFPNLPCGADRVRPRTGTDGFAGPTLEPEWEWNHNPDDTKWFANGGLTLEAATVTSDLYAARNTLTRRMLGPTSTATIDLDFGSMQDGDVAGLAALRDSSAWIGIKREGGAYRVVRVDGLTLDASWNTNDLGTEVESAEVAATRLWLRVAANVRTDAGGGQARFYYSTDGSQFTELGTAFTMKKNWEFFTGYRFAIFNYATVGLGGSVTVRSFELATS